MNQNEMKERAIFPLVLSMSLPMVLSMLINALYNIIDSYYVAKISEDAMTALSLVFPIQNLSGAVAIGFGIGINAAIAISLGAKDRIKANRAASLGMMMSVVHGLVLTVVCIVAMPYFLNMFHPGADIVQLGIRYANVVFLFAVINNAGIAMEKIFQSVGCMKVSMLAMMMGCLTNIILDPMMIFGFGFIPAMGIEGAALATGIGQSVTLLIYIVIYFVRPLAVKIERRRGCDVVHTVGKIYSVGIPATLSLALPSVLVTSLNGILAGYSQVYVLVLGIYYKLQTFIYLTANGIIQGMRPIIGFNYGAGEAKRVRKIFNVVLLMCGVIMFIGTVICMQMSETLIGLFSTSRNVIEAGSEALRIISMGFMFSTVSVTVSGALEGIGKGVPSLMVSLLRYVICMIPMAWILSYMLNSATGVWIAFVITEAITALYSFGLYRKHIANIPIPTEHEELDFAA